jgi:hypothetical protein
VIPRALARPCAISRRSRIEAVLSATLVLAMTPLGVAPASGAPGDYLVRRLHPVGDATVVASSPTTNFGDARWLRVRAGQSWTYLMFRIPPSLRRVEIEAMDLWLTSPTGNGCREPWWPTDVFTTPDDWEEDTITWADAPGPTTWEGSATFFAGGRVGYFTTAGVPSSRTISFLLMMPASCTILHTERYRSSEHDSGEPYLEVSFLREN